MSGGVDSTVSALMLKSKGYEVIGVHMRNWDLVDETGECTADQNAQEAEDICKRVGIPFREVNLVKEYWNKVFLPLIQDYESGLTPNPDILCNSQIKFSDFLQICHEDIGCDAVATGHYARTSFGEDLENYHPDKNVKLLKSMDQVKDQTFFLSQVPQEGLRKVMFPVGGMTKDVVKKLATSSGFQDVAKKKESMGICFIGKRKKGFQKFLEDYVENNPGNVIDIDTGLVIGKHNGVHLWTVGQRIPNTAKSDRLFVARKDADSQTLFACHGRDHPALFCEYFFAGKPHWIDRQPDQLRHGSKSLECEFRFQNTQPLTKCVVSFSMTSTSADNWEFMDQSALTVSSAEPLRAVTPGQFVAFYKGDECLGSAVITRPGPNLCTMGGKT